MFSARGSLPEIIRNDEGLYTGNLRYYFRTVFYKAQNLQRGYHNFRHVFHIVWLCYQAIRFYGDRLSKRAARHLLIAGAWHDFDHPGIRGDDDLNVERAIRAFRRNVEECDKGFEEQISDLIRATIFPYQVPTDTLPLSGQIIRDADMGQAFAMAWLQQVVFGLAEEWGMTPLEVLKQQPGFLGSIKFHTEWGQEMFNGGQILQKVKEAEELIELLA